MVDGRVIIDVLMPFCDVQSIELAIGAAAVQHDIEVVAGNRASQRNGMRGVAAVTILDYVECGKVEGRGALALQFVVPHAAVWSNQNLGHRIGEINSPVEARVAFNDVGLTPFIQNNDIARK